MFRVLTSFASITVPTPTVKASFGTFDMSLSKKRALAKHRTHNSLLLPTQTLTRISYVFDRNSQCLPSSVSCASVLTRVRDTNDEPGSLNA